MTDVLERVKTYQQFIGGEWVDSASGETLDVENPADGKVIAKVQASSAEDVDRAANAAATAFETWQHTTPAERSGMLLKLADAIEARADELGRLESKNAGKPVGAAIDEIPVVVDNLRFFAGARAGDGRQGGQRVRGRPHLDDPARAGRGGRLDRAVELPDHDGRLEDRPGARGRQHGHPQAVGADAADRPGPRPRSPPTSCRPASSTSSPGPARRSAIRSSATPRSGWSRSPATPTPASTSPRSRPTGSSGSTSSSVARRRSSSSTTPTWKPSSRTSRPSASGMRARIAPRRAGSSPVRRSTTSSWPSWPTRSRRSSGATRPRATTSRWAR